MQEGACAHTPVCTALKTSSLEFACFTNVGYVGQLEMYLVRLNEHAGTKRMAVPLENAVEKLRRWQRERHFTARR